MNTCFCLAILSALVLSRTNARQPNFIVILLDDLDETQDSSGPVAMPAINRLLRDKGVTFTNHFVSTPICCPSRVNLLRGQLSHNTNFTDVLGPHGGYAKFRELDLDREWLPVWLQRVGYNTLYTGKFIVDYTIRNRSPAPAGWTAFDALVHPFTFEYYCPAFSLDGGEPKMYPALYVTDVVSAKARALLRSAAADPSGRPFYLQVAPPAPHHSMHYNYNASGVLTSRHWYPPVPADRHWENASFARLPQPPNFNDPFVHGKPVWLQAIERLSPGNVTFIEEVYRLRLRALLAVDEMVAAIVAELAQLGLADSTYLVFTSDNGYHEGNHRMGGGKTTAYEEDLRVPLVVAGPGLQPGSRVDATTQHIDLAPTVLALAGAPLPSSLDGTPLPLAAVSDGTLPDSYSYGGPTSEPLRNQFLAEFWGVWDDETLHSHPAYLNLTWRAVRVLRSDQSEAYKYVMHCSGEVELYDLVRDPYERFNLLSPVTRRRGWWRELLDSWVSPRLAVERDAGGDSADSESDAAWSRTFGAAAVVVRKGAEAWARTAWAVAARVAQPATGSGSAGAAEGTVARHTRARGRGSGGGGSGGGDGPSVAMGAAYARWLLRIRSRLDALLAVLAVCEGPVCVRPFLVLHPDGAVSDLWAAMDEKYDDMYEQIKPFTFVRCLRYQDVNNELSQFRGAVLSSCEQGAHCPQAGHEVAEQVAHASDTSGKRRGGVGTEGDGEGSTGGKAVGGGNGTFVYVEAEELKGAAAPLPPRYALIRDIYGLTAEHDTNKLA